MSLALLKQRIADLVEGPKPESGSGLSTGIRALDAALEGSGGGVPRGRLTEITGARGSGRTTLVRMLAWETARAGGGVALVDAQRTLAPQDWASLGSHEDVWFVRPRDATRAAWCADVLLRSGAFALVVLDGAPALSRAVGVRLTRLARDASAALVIVGGGGAEGGSRRGLMVGGALRLRCTSAERGRGGRKKREVFVVTVEKGGDHQRVEVGRAVRVARRLCAHSEVPDRRGVATTPDAGHRTPDSEPRAAPHIVSPRTGARSRRCGEAQLGSGPDVFGLRTPNAGSIPLGRAADRAR